MVRLSIHARQALAKLTLPILIIATFALMLVGKADALLAERARIAVADALAPIFATAAAPLSLLRHAPSEVAGLWTLRTENARLREENEQLRRWQAVALALDLENQKLKASLRWVPDPVSSFITARVIADAGGLYARAALLSVGPGHGLRKGAVAVDERGLVGRVTEVGSRTARVLLITDLNSRIPVILEASRARAMLVGTNGPRPRLLYWPDGSAPRDGERIVTSAEANAFPANLPIGTVRYTAGGTPEVDPDAMLQSLEIVRVFDFSAAAPAPADAESPVATPGRH